MGRAEGAGVVVSATPTTPGLSLLGFIFRMDLARHFKICYSADIANNQYPSYRISKTRYLASGRIFVNLIWTGGVQNPPHSSVFCPLLKEPSSHT